MRIEIIKTRKGFRIPQLESMTVPDRLFATVELPSPVIKPLTPVRKDTTRRLLEKTIMNMSGDKLLEGILCRLPKGYLYVPDGMSDADVLYEALKDKYGL
jgi:hypothetical protein